jgi:hypothetical protein
VNVALVGDLRALRDSKMPWIARAVDHREIDQRIAPMIAIDGRYPRLSEIRIARHKPGRRCVIEYVFESELRVYGKIRARGTDVRSHEVLTSLWEAGFRPRRDAPFSVPEPIGIVPALQLTLQRAAPGRLATEAVEEPKGASEMVKVANAIHALHTSDVQPHRRHALADELGILEERLRSVAQTCPRWRGRIDRVYEACAELAFRLDGSQSTCIHRDFYPDQVLLDGDRLTLLDFDLFTRGDPALDVGNFLGHLIEQALRRYGDPARLRDREEALEEAYLARATRVERASLGAWATLTLARHIHISRSIPDRSHLTSDLLELCEERLGIRSSSAA